MELPSLFSMCSGIRRPGPRYPSALRPCWNPGTYSTQPEGTSLSDGRAKACLSATPRLPPRLISLPGVIRRNSRRDNLNGGQGGRGGWGWMQPVQVGL
eukprot:2016630-Rhodomonas_salina.1